MTDPTRPATIHRETDGAEFVRDQATGQVVGRPVGSLTPKQLVMAEGIADGLTQTEAARRAGYAYPGVEAARQRDNTELRRKIYQIRTRKLDKIASLAISQLERLLKSPKTKESTLATLIPYSLGLAGHVAPKAGEDAGLKTDLSSMTMAELEQFSREWKQRIDKTKVIGNGSTIDQVSTVPADASDDI